MNSKTRGNYSWVVVAVGALMDIQRSERAARRESLDHEQKELS